MRVWIYVHVYTDGSKHRASRTADTLVNVSALSAVHTVRFFFFQLLGYTSYVCVSFCVWSHMYVAPLCGGNFYLCVMARAAIDRRFVCDDGKYI